MTPRRRMWLLVVLAAALAGAAGGAGAARQGAGDAAFAKLSSDFISGWLERHPTLATRLGVHTWDARLRPITEATVADDDAWLGALQTRLAAIPRARLSFDEALDYDLLENRLARERFDLETVRPWERNPNTYLDAAAGSIQILLQRDFASPQERLRSVIGRLRMVPEALRAAQVNLKHPPRIYTEIAISQFGGALTLYRQDLPAFVHRIKDARLEAEVIIADSTAARAVQEFITYLRQDLLPRSDGDFRLGREVYQRKLALDEMETAPVESLLARATAELAVTRARMDSLAGTIAPGRTAAAELDTMALAAPPETALVAAIEASVQRARGFVASHRLVSPPPMEHLIVREAPSFQRSTSFASMDSPGVWETKATEAFLNVTPPDAAWSPAQKREHLGFFNRWSADIVAVHEAIPGHYYQGLGRRAVPSRLRQILASGSNVEGWAHYCEQMVIEEGFGADDPRYAIAQLSLALQRLGRTIVGLSLHTGTMTLDQAVTFFEDQCWMPRVNAEREARRGAIDPTYLVYTLGKWRILDLRAELRHDLGSRFSLRDFHDSFLRQGPIPLPIVRQAMLHELAPGAASARPAPETARQP